MPYSSYNTTNPNTGGGLTYGEALVATATNYTRTGVTTWGEVDSTNLRTSVAAAAGDIILVTYNLLAASSLANNACDVDVHTVVSGSRVNSVTTKTAVDNTSGGAARCQETALAKTLTGAILYPVQTSDVSGSTVTFTLVFRTEVAGQTMTIFKNAVVPVELNAINLKTSAYNVVPATGYMFTHLAFS